MQILESVPKRNMNEVKTPLFIYDAPDGYGCLVLHALLRIVSKDACKNILSAFILPELPNRLYIEAIDSLSVRSSLRTISNIGKIPKQLSIIKGSSINNFFCNPVRCLHFHPGQIVTIHNPEFPRQIAQIIDIKADKGKILVKTIPHIDYDLLRQHPHLESQKILNEMMDHTYHPPMNLFRKDEFTTTQSNIVYWNCKVNSIKWDGKDFIDNFQYIYFKYTEIQIKRNVTEEEKAIFEQGMTSFEGNNQLFVQWFRGSIHEVNNYSSDKTLTILENTGRPSWARKPNQILKKSPPEPSVSEHRPHKHQQEQAQNEHELVDRFDNGATQNINDECNFSNSISDEFANVKQHHYTYFPEFIKQSDSCLHVDSSSICNGKFDKIDPLLTNTVSSPNSVTSFQNSGSRTKSDNSEDSNDVVVSIKQSYRKSDFGKTKQTLSKSKDLDDNDGTEIISTQSSSDSEKQKELKREKISSKKKHATSQKPNLHYFESSDDSASFAHQPHVRSEKLLMKIRRKPDSKVGTKSYIKSLLQKSTEFGEKPPDEKIYFPLKTSSSDDENHSVIFQPEFDKKSILNEQSQMIKKKKFECFIKKKGSNQNINTNLNLIM